MQNQMKLIHQNLKFQNKINKKENYQMSNNYQSHRQNLYKIRHHKEFGKLFHINIRRVDH
ncbi:MAG: hypothetical protein CME25_24190 [Gemmatimonadetes bacterium]|nr:hypothetical protein [Gemmatimonadota bacterium]